MACARGVKAGPTKAIIIRSDRILFTRDIGASGLLKKYIIKTEAHKPYNDPPGSD
jgi:hypothetical protein